MKQKTRPGVMLYFDSLRCIKRLNDAQKGRLFNAILEYAEFGVLPDVDSDSLLAVVWDNVQPRIDADADRYAAVCEKRRQAADKRWHGDDPENAMHLDADGCKSMQMHASESNCVQVMPTQPKINSNPTPTPTTNPAPAPEASAMGGTGGSENTHPLTQNEWIDLLSCYN